MKKLFKGCGLVLFACAFCGCVTDTMPQEVVEWKLPPNLGKAKNEIGIQMHGPMATNGKQLEPGLAQQFIEAVQSKMIQSKRFHIYLPNQFGELPNNGDADIVIKPFVDVIEQPMRTENGREGVAHICKVMLDVKMFDKDDGQAKEAINLDGIWKVVVPSVFGKPARDVDIKGIVVKAYEEAYKLLEKEINKNFPPAANVVSARAIPIPPPVGWKPGDPPPEPMLKVATKGGANIGFKTSTRYFLFTMVEGSAVVIALLDADSIMDEKASFKSVLINATDPEALDMWTRIKAKEEGIRLFVTPYFN